MRTLIRLLAVALAAMTLPACTREIPDPKASEAAPEGVAASSPAAVAISEETLFDHERYWPYRVKTAEPWTPDGGERTLRPGTPGVLVRMTDRRQALVDFAGLGVHRIPVSATDMVQSARSIAAGKRHKFGPNLLVALGPRLIDVRGNTPQPMPPEFMKHRALLLVMADPEGEEFEDMAGKLAPLQEIEGFSAILLPQGADVKTGALFEKLHRLTWKAPFVQPHLSASYTEGYLPSGLAPPVLALHNREGRLLYQASWHPDTVAHVRQAAQEHLAQSGAAVGTEVAKDRKTAPQSER